MNRQGSQVPDSVGQHSLFGHMQTSEVTTMQYLLCARYIQCSYIYELICSLRLYDNLMAQMPKILQLVMMELGFQPSKSLPLNHWPFITCDQIDSKLLNQASKVLPTLSLTICLDDLCAVANTPYSHILSQDRCRSPYFTNTISLPGIISSLPLPSI